jgi:hypothetical protein
MSFLDSFLLPERLAITKLLHNDYGERKRKEKAIREIQESKENIYPGIDQTYKLPRNIDISLTKKEVTSVLQKCKSCQFNKTHTKKTHTKLQPILPPMNNSLDLSMEVA